MPESYKLCLKWIQFFSRSSASILSTTPASSFNIATAQQFVSDQHGHISNVTFYYENPNIQVFHATETGDPLPFIYCHDLVSSSFERENLKVTDLDHFYFSTKEMKKPVIFDIDHSWRVFSLAHNVLDGLWMCNLSGKAPLELIKRCIKGLTFKSSWIAEVQVDLQNAVAYIKLIMAHPYFVSGIPLPQYFNNSLLLSSLHSTDQAHQLHSLAITVMGELLTFINQWRLTVGENWASNFSAFIQSFLCLIQKMRLPIGGGIFNAKEWVHGFFINRSIRTGCLTFILNTGSSSHCKRLLCLNKLLINIFLKAQIYSSSLLEAGKILELQPFLENLQTTDANLQPLSLYPTSVHCSAEHPGLEINHSTHMVVPSHEVDLWATSDLVFWGQ